MSPEVIRHLDHGLDRIHHHEVNDGIHLDRDVVFRDHDLRFLTIIPLQITAHQQIELLIGAAQFHVGLQRHGIIALD